MFILEFCIFTFVENAFTNLKNQYNHIRPLFFSQKYSNAFSKGISKEKINFEDRFLKRRSGIRTPAKYQIKGETELDNIRTQNRQKHR